MVVLSKEVTLLFGPFPIHLYGESAHPVIFKQFVLTMIHLYTVHIHVKLLKAPLWA